MLIDGISHTLTFSCPDTTGIVASVGTRIYSMEGAITEAQHYRDESSDFFYSRLEFLLPPTAHPTVVWNQLQETLAPFAAEWEVSRVDDLKRIAIITSGDDDVLPGLSLRWQRGDLAVRSANYIAEAVPDSMGRNLSVHALPSSSAELSRLLRDLDVDLLVCTEPVGTAPSLLSGTLPVPCIAVRTFLPDVVAPIRETTTTGAKLLGATAFYVNDAGGEIIEQQVVQIGQLDGPETLARKERQVREETLARALALHLDDRVILRDGSAVVFPG